MKKNTTKIYSGPWGFLAQLVVMTLAAILAAYFLPGVQIQGVGTAIITALVIALLNNFIRPILIVITLPFTVFSMGLFLLVVNALIILMASALVPQFHVSGIGSALLFSILLTVFNYLLEIPNKLMRRPEYQPSDKEQLDDQVDTDEEGYTAYEEVPDNDNNENQQ